jgi:hypothetical protein
MGPLGSGPLAEIIKNELVAQKREKSQQKGPKAGRVGEVREIDVLQPEAKLPARHQVTVVQGAPSAQAVVDPRRGKWIVGIEANFDLNLLPASGANVDLDRALGEGAGTVCPDAMTHQGQHLRKSSAVGGEAP